MRGIMKKVYQALFSRATLLLFFASLILNPAVFVADEVQNQRPEIEFKWMSPLCLDVIGLIGGAISKQSQ